MPFFCFARSETEQRLSYLWNYVTLSMSSAHLQHVVGHWTNKDAVVVIMKGREKFIFECVCGCVYVYVCVCVV